MHIGPCIEERVLINSFGRIVEATWKAIPQHFGHTRLDHFVVMPNHIHGILFIEDKPDVGAQYIVPLQQQTRSFGSMSQGSILSIVRTYKAAVTREVNKLKNRTAHKFWQRNYYEDVIRDENDLNRIREYILTNPARWSEDKYYQFLE